MTEIDHERFARHLMLEEIGEPGQRELAAARVLLVGVGGIGSASSLYLTAAGLGTLGLVDPDVVELSNLQRQVVYTEGDLGLPKVERAARRLAQMSSSLKIESHAERLDHGNAARLVEAFDVVIDGCDSFATRDAINRACVHLGKPMVHGSLFQLQGQVSTFDARLGPCYRCLAPELPPEGLVPRSSEVGVLGTVAGLVGLLQATEVIKLVTGSGSPLIGRVAVVDALGPSARTITIRKDPGCPICSGVG